MLISGRAFERYAKDSKRVPVAKKSQPMRGSTRRLASYLEGLAFLP